MSLLGRWRLAPATLRIRGVGALTLLPSLAVLGTAFWLTPSPSGIGTHQQLGLDPCGFLTLFGLPCPMCGMTTTFAMLAHFDLVGGFANQPFGAVLFFFTLIAACIGMVDLTTAWGGWRRFVSFSLRNDVAVAVVVLGGLLVGWVYKMVLFSKTVDLVP